MVILNQSGRTLTEWSKITRIISIGNNGNDKREREKRGRNTCAVVAVYDGRESTVMGEYGSEEQCIVNALKFEKDGPTFYPLEQAN